MASPIPGPASRLTYRTYLGLAALGLAVISPLAQAANLFTSQPLDASRFAVLARPVGTRSWNLLVLEQIRPQPLCWEQRPDGLTEPTLNRFDFTGICNRYLDSNGYSLRIGDQDLASRYRLQLRQSGAELRLEASTASEATVLVVGRGQVPMRDKDGFVALTLEPGWDLRRRSFNAQTLNHIYFANPIPLPLLLAAANGGLATTAQPPMAPPPLPAEPTTGTGRSQLLAQGPIRLPVIPFRE